MKLRQIINQKVIKWNEAIKGASTEKVALKLNRLKKRWLCRNDLYYLCCLTGWREIAKYRAFYQPFCSEVSLMNWQVVKLDIHKTNEDLLKIEDATDKKDLKYLQRLYLCYRTLYKTTIITKVHSLQLVLNFPNIHIVLCHNVFNNASANLNSIKEMLLNPNIRRLFPECIPNTKEWGNRNGFSLANRTDKNRDEENIMAVGVDTEITGGHWQIAKKNDLVTEKSINTEEQIKKTIDWDDRFNTGHFDNPHINLQDYEGTRYHHSDLYSKRQSNKSIKFIKIPLMRDVKDNSSAIHPERFSPEAIQRIKDDKTPWVFMCQMQQEPQDPSTMQFEPAMFVYYDTIPEFCNFYLIVDPASKRKKKSDYTVLMVVGIDGKGNKYIVDVIRDKLNPKQRIDTAIELARKWKIKASGWEEVGLGDDNFYLEEKRRKEQLFFDVIPVKTQVVSKEDRIRNTLIPEYAQHQWFWPAKDTMKRYRTFDGKNYDVTEELELELLQFPYSIHDDLSDVQTFLKQMDIIKPRDLNVGENSNEMTFGEYGQTVDLRKQTKKDPWVELLKVRSG